MKKTVYIYTGPLSGVSLRGVGDVLLIPGSKVALPAGHTYTDRLIRKGWLKEVQAESLKKTTTNPEEN